MSDLNRNEMPLFGKSSRSPAEIVKSLKEAVVALERGDKRSEKVTKNVFEEKFTKIFQLQEEVNKNLQAVKSILYGSVEAEPQTELVAQLAQETYSSNLIPHLAANLAKFDFEVKNF